MKPSTQRFLSAILAIVLLVASFIIFFDIIQPAYGNLEALKGKLAGEQSLLATESSTLSSLAGVIAKYNTQASSQDAVNATFPNGQNIAGAVAQMVGIAQANSIAIQNVSISATAATQNGTGLGTSASAWLVKPTGTIAFVLTGVGSYGNLKNFLRDLEDNVRIFDLKQLSIQPAPTVTGRSASPTQDLFSYVITANTYYQVN